MEAAWETGTSTCSGEMGIKLGCDLPPSSKEAPPTRHPLGVKGGRMGDLGLYPHVAAS